MPKLLLFAACEKVLIDQQNNASLISLLQEVKVQVPEAGPLPAQGTAAALKWDVLTLWLKTDDDIGKHYEQRIELFNPEDHSTDVSGTAPIPFEPQKTGHRLTATIVGFPLGWSGRYTLKLWLYESGHQMQAPIAEYPIVVSYEVLKK